MDVYPERENKTGGYGFAEGKGMEGKGTEGREGQTGGFNGPDLCCKYWFLLVSVITILLSMTARLTISLPFHANL